MTERKYKTHLIIMISLIAFLSLVPFITSIYVVRTLTLCFIYALLAISFDFSYGQAGILNLGFEAFFGIGAYTSGLLTTHASASPFIGLLAAALMAMLFGFLLGLICLRMRGVASLVITTIAFNETLKVIATNLEKITGGELGLPGIPSFGPLFSDYFIALSVLLLVYFIITKIKNSKIGLAMNAIRDDWDLAQALGINGNWYRLLTFMITCSFAGAAGSIYAHYMSTVTPSAVFSFDIVALLLLASLIGGKGTTLGALLSAPILILITEVLRPIGPLRFIMYGGLTIILITYMPDGIMGWISKWQKSSKSSM